MHNFLNLGSGYTSHPDYINVDIMDYGNNIVADVREYIPFEKAHFDFVLANHTLQMFTYDELPIVLDNIQYVMKPGATLRIITPDLDKAVNAYLNAEIDFFPIDHTIERTLAGKFARYMFWHGQTRCAFTVESLRFLLSINGFKNVKIGKFGDCELDSRENESLVMECQR